MFQCLALVLTCRLNGKEGHVVGENKGKVVYIPFRETGERKKELDMRLLKSSKVLAM